MSGAAARTGKEINNKKKIQIKKEGSGYVRNAYKTTKWEESMGKHIGSTYRNNGIMEQWYLL